LTAKKLIATKWMGIDQDYLRTKTAISSCASHEHKLRFRVTLDEPVTVE